MNEKKLFQDGVNYRSPKISCSENMKGYLHGHDC